MATLAAVALLAGAAAAEHPGRQLESGRASAPVVYLATVSAVFDDGHGDMPAPPIYRATLKVDRVLLSGSPDPAPAQVTVRYEHRFRREEGSSRMEYSVAIGDRAVVFAPSFQLSYPIEMITGPPKTVSAQVSALRAYLAAMDDVTASLHGVTPAIRARQIALYDRILAELGSARTP